jgi:hypothetical protein
MRGRAQEVELGETPRIAMDVHIGEDLAPRCPVRRDGRVPAQRRPMTGAARSAVKEGPSIG